MTGKKQRDHSKERRGRELGGEKYKKGDRKGKLRGCLEQTL